eukprot:COSAG02_NODE_1331_length_13215_cov_3.173058_3_plen_512_part_00
MGVFDVTLRKGFSLFAVPSPNRGVSVQPYDRAELQVRLIPYTGQKDDPAPAQYFAVETCTLCNTNGGTNCSEVPPAAQCSLTPKLVKEVTCDSFYSKLLQHATTWQKFHGVSGKENGHSSTDLAAFDLQIHGSTEGTRVVDTARSVISAGLSNFVGLRPNYGDGSVYWSVAGLDRGALPLQSFALNHALVLWGHHQQAAQRLEYYFNVYVRNESGLTPSNAAGMNRELWDRTPGKIDFKNWGPDARSGWPARYQRLFQDSIADYGRFLELWAETARALEDEDPTWIKRTFVTIRTMTSYLFSLHNNATQFMADPPASGLIVGPAEHDTCKDRGPFFSINGWTWRGWTAVLRFLDDTVAVQDARFVAQLHTHITRLAKDLKSAIRESLVQQDGLFLPPYPAKHFPPYQSMIQKTRGHEPNNGCSDFAVTDCLGTANSTCDCTGFAGGPTYSGFRYYSEMLSSGVLNATVSNAVNDFREAHTGTLSGMTRYSDHLDDMPAGMELHVHISIVAL